MRVLIADDDPISRKLAEVAATRQGHQALFACDGKSAWEILQAPDSPQLVILDWNMPGLSGLELCRKIRGRDNAHYTYILMVTSNAAFSDLITGLESGADDYVVKPFDRRELEARLAVGRRIIDLESRLLSTQDELTYLVSHDYLTGAWNRRAILERLEMEISRSQRHHRDLGVCLIDLDHFKAINDRYGHMGGDLVLREVVRRWTSTLRPSDVLARYGGEEFLVLLPDCELASLGLVCERLCKSITRTIITLKGGIELSVSCSIGATAFCGQPEITADDLAQSADKALYRAKENGRNRVEIMDLPKPR